MTAIALQQNSSSSSGKKKYGCGIKKRIRKSSSWPWGAYSLGSNRAEVCPEAAPSPVDDLVPRYFETGPMHQAVHGRSRVDKKVSLQASGRGGRGGRPISLYVSQKVLFSLNTFGRAFEFVARCTSRLSLSNTVERARSAAISPNSCW